MDEHAENVPVHEEIAPLATADGVRISEHSVPAPVLADTYAIFVPLKPGLVEATYCEPTTEQPACVLSVGSAPLVDANSATDVLHAATAASVSDIFERTT